MCVAVCACVRWVIMRMCVCCCVCIVSIGDDEDVRVLCVHVLYKCVTV